MTNIKNNNYRKIDCKIIKDNYIDTVISKDEVNSNNIFESLFAAKLNFSNVSENHVISDVAWDKSVLSDNVLKNIGYTGVDNGFIYYERDRIGNDEFLELYTNSNFDLSTYNNRFFVTKINGNSGMMEYPIENHNDYTSLKGGFYQGFFKIYGDIYQTLPHRIENEWNISMTIRKRNYETPSNILNNRHKNNKGLFFYIGTRSENKFWELYKSNDKMNDLKYDNSNEYSIDYSIMDSSVIEHQYHEDIPNPENRDDKYDELCGCLKYFEEGFNPYEDNPDVKTTKYENDYFSDDYTGLGTTVGCDCPTNVLAIDDEYLQKQIQLDDIKLKDSKGNPIGEKGFYEIETNNKFIIFNNTKNGFTTKTWDDNYKFILTDKKDSPNINYYEYLNRTSKGFDKNQIDEIINEHMFTYNIFNDIECNALGFKINDDGSISYRYLSVKCEIIEETSKPNIIKNDEWNNIHIKIKRKNTEICNKCDEYYKPAKMQIFIYVNGYLKLVSKELPELVLKHLNDGPERQEGIPYSLSIGGGTQGLSERILLNYYDRTDYILPIEKYFAGSFIGDIKDFTFNPNELNFSAISKKRNGF